MRSTGKVLPRLTSDGTACLAAAILAMLIGVSFPSIIHPILGIMLSIPAATIIAIFFEDWKNARHRK